MNEEQKQQFYAFMDDFVREMHEDGIRRSIAIKAGINALTALSIDIFDIAEEQHEVIVDWQTDTLLASINRHYGILDRKLHLFGALDGTSSN